MKDSGYYSEERDDIQELMDISSDSKVFDIGCGEGGFGRALKKLGCRYVFGLEIIPEVAEKAKSHYEMVFAENIETFGLPFKKNYFDYIVCADVLEHLKNPWSVLKKLHSHLKEDGFLLASLPNIRNRFTVGELLRGNFNYQEWGVMDNTHMRFFTLKSMVQLFKDTGYLIDAVKPYIDSDASEHLENWNRNSIKERISDLVKLLTDIDYFPSDDALQEFFTIQFVFKVRKMP